MADQQRAEEDAVEKHLVKLLIDQGVYPTVTCPFDPADEARPCWPHTEYGERLTVEEGTKLGCVYRDWIEEVGIDCCTNTVELTFVMEPHWPEGAFEFELGPQVDPRTFGQRMDELLGSVRPVNDPDGGVR